MHKWRMWSVGICLAALLVPGCTMFRASSEARHPVPAALEWPEFDREPLGRGIVGYSLPTETPATTVVGDVWSRGAAQQRDAFWQRVLRDRCAAREALQVANGGKPDPDPVCQKAQDRKQ
jgi:hypothetical protein